MEEDVEVGTVFEGGTTNVTVETPLVGVVGDEWVVVDDDVEVLVEELELEEVLLAELVVELRIEDE